MSIIISVCGGIASVVSCPPGIDIEIHDYDNGKEFPGKGEDGVVDKGDGVFEFEGQTYEEDDEGGWYSQS